MCGFVGYLFPEPVPEHDLNALSSCIRHRGPDQAGHTVSQGYGISTRRLSILDLSAAGNQPMESKRYILGFNGEIYNHRELRDQIPAGVASFTSHCDTETVLCALEYLGIHDTLTRLNGMYALAVWDKLEKELTLARDPLGIKPLLYGFTEKGMYFGSELKALRPFAPGKVSREGMALYLLLGFVPAPYSLLEGVRKVRPGEALAFRGAGKASSRIVPRSWEQQTCLDATLSGRVRQMREAVENAVDRQLISDVPVGLFLSGGVDSSIIAAVASARKPGLTSFTVRPDSALADPGAQGDADIAASFAQSLGLSHYELVVGPQEIAEELDALPGLMDEPVSELYFMAEVLLSRKARSVGVPVVLTGHGGDELFLGYPTYLAAIKGDRYDRIPFLGPLLKVIGGLPVHSFVTRQNLLGAANVWRKPLLERYMLVSAVHFSVEEAAILTGLPVVHVRDLVENIAREAFEATLCLPRTRPLGTSELFARMDMLLKVPENYNMRLDKATMSASIEARVPFQDFDLISLVMHLPAQDLLHGGIKGLLKQAFADVLPAEVISRRKQTFQAPMLSWTRGPLAQWTSAQIASLPEPMQRVLSASTKDPASTKQAYRVWCLGMLEGWRNAFGLEY